MPTATVENPDLRDQVAAAEAEVQQLEEQASTAKPAELGRLASSLATARTMLDIVGRRHKAAVAAQQATQTAREHERAEHARVAAVGALKTRTAACNAAWQKWGADAEATEASVKELWERYADLQREATALAAVDGELGTNLAPPNPGEVASGFVERCRSHVGALRFYWDVRRGIRA